MEELHELLLLDAAVAVDTPLCELLLQLADGEGGLRYGERRVTHRLAASPRAKFVQFLPGLKVTSQTTTAQRRSCHRAEAGKLHTPRGVVSSELACE